MGVGCSCLDENQYVILDHPTGRSVEHGPGCIPYCCATKRKRDGVTLDNTEYLRVEHLGAGGQDVIEIVTGPQFYRPDDAYATVGQKHNKINLTAKQYIRVIDELSGEKKIVEGPQMYCPGQYEKCSKATNKLDLSNVQYVVVRNEQDGSMETIVGPTLFTPGSYQVCSDAENQVVLSNNEYVHVTHTQTGEIEIIQGPQTFAPQPHDKVSSTYKKIVLRQFEYVKIVDSNSGIVRVERGPSTITLQPYEKSVRAAGQKQDVNRAYEINEHRAVMIMNTDSGNQELIQIGYNHIECDDIPTSFMFIPSATQEIMQDQEKIRLEQHESMVIVDKDGRYTYHRGSDETRAFFVPPYCKVLEQIWSVDLQKNKDEVEKVSRFDLRPQYMDFEFLIRTKDNVEIIIDLNFYWQILDLEKMISVTSDAPEDICKHAMSQILSESSRKEMKDFMESFNEIVQGAISKDDSFYIERGVTIHKVEITGRRCKDEQTEKIFHEIIKEKTNRIKNMEKQGGENEVQAQKLEGEIRLEELDGKKLQVRKGFMREEATADGQSEADRIANFIDNLPETLSSQERLKIYFDVQNTTRVKALAESQATMYVTREDMDISITNIDYRGNDRVLPLKSKK